MKKRFYLKVPWIVIICLFVLSTISIKAQSTGCDFPCDTSQWWEQVENIQIDNFDQDTTIGLNGIIYYRARICNGRWEFLLDSAVMFDNSKFLDSLMIYHHNFSAFRDLIDLYIVEESIGIMNMPNCPDSNTITKIYSAACGVWVRCRYEIDTNSRMCDSGFAAPFPDYTFNGIKYVDILKYESCGEICCEKTYTVCVKNNFTGLEPITFVKQIQKQRHQETPNCTLQNQFRDGRTNQLIQCQDGC
ncbi:MAG: hypothetical protein JNL36_08095 [Candidatus Kapabacteria bacterium]|nr:hypothetical protein [Candidatus Kapabacteria bacterium]